MSDTFAQFERRLDSLERKHRELASGYVARINPGGLITVEPKRHRSWLKLRILASMILSVVCFKIMTMVIVGPVIYQSRVDALLAGTGFEKAAAWVLQADPLTQRIALMLNTFFG